MRDYFRPNIASLAGYAPGEQPRDPRVLKLNTNENPYPPSPKVLEAIRRCATDRLRFYPDPLATEFRRAAAQLFDIDEDGIIATNGSDDALTILARGCLDADDALVAPTPSYPLYEVLAKIQGCRFELRPFLPDGSLPRNLVDEARLTIVPNPNSPTGTFVPPSDLLAQAERSKGLVVSDEAYVDFAPSSSLPLLSRCERLVVTRSFSKSYSLAGIRFGFLAASPEIARTLVKVKDSYNVDQVSIAAATAALGDQDYFLEAIRKVKATRARLERELTDLGFDVTPSHANFVWVRRRQPLLPLQQALKERGILVRYLSYPQSGEGLRISIGQDADIDRLLTEIKSLS